MSIRKKSNAIREIEKIRKGQMAFKDLLYAVRTTEEISQVRLAKKAGTSKAKICDFEKGRRIPNLELAARLARSLGHSETVFVTKLIEDQLKDAKLKLKIKVEAA